MEKVTPYHQQQTVPDRLFKHCKTGTELFAAIGGWRFQKGPNQNTRARAYTHTHTVYFTTTTLFKNKQGKNEVLNRFKWTFALLTNFESHFAILITHIPKAALTRSGTHLIWSFGGHFSPLLLSKSVTLKVVGAFPFNNHLVECALFLPVDCFRPAAATPGCVILFYPARRETCHEKPYGKSKVHYLIFIARNAKGCAAVRWIMEKARRGRGGGD